MRFLDEVATPSTVAATTLSALLRRGRPLASTRSEQLVACHDEQVSGLGVRSFIDEDGYSLFYGGIL